MVATIKFSQFASINLSSTTNLVAGISAPVGGQNVIMNWPIIWTTATRPSPPSQGFFGFNTSIHDYELYNGTTWVPVGGGSAGTVTQVNTGTGLTGGPITTVGTLSFESIAANSLWANLTGAPAVPAVVPTSTFLLSANNLSDVPNKATARTNLGLAIGTNVEAWSAILDQVAAGTWPGATSITTLGTIAFGTWQSTPIGLAYGGTNTNLTATNNALVVGTNTGMAFLALTNSAILASSSAGVPTWLGPLTNGQVIIGSTGNIPVASTLTAGSGVSIVNAGGSITISATGSGGTVTSITAGSGLTGGTITTTGTIALSVPVSLANGGTGASLSSSNNQLVYGAGGVMAFLATTNNGVLITSGGGVPSISSILPTAVQSNITQLGTQIQALNMGSFQINALASPSVGTDAANKSYVDTVAAGLEPAEIVELATTANIPCTYNNGASGVGATITVTATGLLALDGVNVVATKRYLFKNQATGFQNGIYDCTVTGTGGLNPVFTRSLDYNTPADINATGIIPVRSGNTQAGTGWYETATITTIGTDALTYVQFGNSGTVTSVTFTGDGTVLSSTPSSAVTTSGTLTATLKTQSANLVFAGPTSGGATTPTFRSLVTADMPAGTGTVTSVSVVSANNFTGTVATSTTTPAITIGANPGLFVSSNASVSNVTGDGTDYTLTLANADLNVGSILNTSTGTFTLPNTAMYILTGSLELAGLTSSHTSLTVKVTGVTGNELGTIIAVNPFATANNAGLLRVAICYPIYAPSTTAMTIVVRVSNGSKVVTVGNGTTMGLSLIR